MDMKNRNQDRESWEKMMKNNKPVKVKEYPRYLGWEKCVKEYWDREARGEKR